MTGSITAELERCRLALSDDAEAATDAPAQSLLEALGHQVPVPFEPHRHAFLEVLAEALYADGDETRVRTLYAKFAARAGAGEPGAEAGDDWTVAPPERLWLIRDWLPAGRVAMLTGEGGAGKSRLALQLCAALARGCSQWLPGSAAPIDRAVGLESGAVSVFATWEDEADQVARTLHTMGVAGEVGDRLRYVAPRGPVWAPDPAGSRHTSTLGVLTDGGRWLRAYCERWGAVLLVLDPRAAAFGLNENDRALVRGFMADWDAWGRRSGCTVVLIAHPPKGESDYSGSTDWHAAARSVWVLGCAETGTGDPRGGEGRSKREPAPAPRLACVKSSYARRPAPVWLSGYPSWRGVDARVAADAWATVTSGDVLQASEMPATVRS